MAPFRTLYRIVSERYNQDPIPKIKALRSHQLIFSRGIASRLFVGGMADGHGGIFVQVAFDEIRHHKWRRPLEYVLASQMMRKAAKIFKKKAWNGYYVLIFLCILFVVIAGLSFYTTEKALSEAFSQFGQVIEAKIIMDRVSDRSKGFGFVTFASEDEAQKALNEMNGKVLNGRTIFVDTAKARRPLFDDGVPIARGPPQPPSQD